MKSSGNGHPAVCVNNLLRLFRGEVPYERVKGIDPRIIDQPKHIAEGALRQDADWLIETYEPRIQLNDVKINIETGQDGALTVTAEISEKEA